MSIVTLVSGGLDSTLIAKLAQEEGVQQFPLFVDYGQIARDRELAACKTMMKRFDLPQPKLASLGGYGALIQSGLTNAKLDVFGEAFTPGRNMLFLLVAAAYAQKVGANAVSIGLLHEDTSLFPDQTSNFLSEAQKMLSLCMGTEVRVLAPLSNFHKIEVAKLAKEKGINGTYSCHTGEEMPCGICIACKEYEFKGEQNGGR